MREAIKDKKEEPKKCASCDLILTPYEKLRWGCFCFDCGAVQDEIAHATYLSLEL